MYATSSSARSWSRRDVFLGLLPLLLGLELLAAVVFVPTALKGNGDFRQFYSGGYMIRVGYAHSFYEPNLQKAVQDQLFRPVERLLAVSHPAVEYLLIFAPLSFLPYRVAYLVFAGINCALLAYVMLVLRPRVNDDWFLAAAFLGFIPACTAILQGQDTVIVLLFLVIALRTDSEWRMGLLVGLGAFRFQLVIPILILYALWRRWRFVCGFAISSCMLALISVAVTGMRESFQYIHFLLTANWEGAELVSMPNIRGLVGAFGGNAWVVLVMSILLLAYCALHKPSFNFAMSAAALLGYHSFSHDLIILLPAIVTSRLWLSWVGGALCLIPGYSYVAAIPVLIDLVVMTHSAPGRREDANR